MKHADTVLNACTAIENAMKTLLYMLGCLSCLGAMLSSFYGQFCPEALAVGGMFILCGVTTSSLCDAANDAITERNKMIAEIGRLRTANRQIYSESNLT